MNSKAITIVNLNPASKSIILQREKVRRQSNSKQPPDGKPDVKEEPEDQDEIHESQINISSKLEISPNCKLIYKSIKTELI